VDVKFFKKLSFFGIARIKQFLTVVESYKKPKVGIFYFGRVHHHTSGVDRLENFRPSQATKNYL